MADYWIKLYIEIIDDAKMATLPDRLWRRIVELFLLAGKLGKGGQLPDTKQIAWTLRLNTDDLDLDLQQIATTGIIERTVNGWFIVNFAKRQAPVPTAERMRKSRERKHREQYYNDNEGVTQQLRNVTQINRLTDTDTEAEEATTPVFSDDCQLEKIYQAVTGQIAIPSTRRDDTLSALRAIFTDKKTVNASIIYLQPFWSEWKNVRHYQQTNAAWLTDWAVTGEIPTQKKDPIKPNGKKRILTGADGQQIEVEQ